MLKSGGGSTSHAFDWDHNLCESLRNQLKRHSFYFSILIDFIYGLYFSIILYFYLLFLEFGMSQIFEHIENILVTLGIFAHFWFHMFCVGEARQGSFFIISYSTCVWECVV